MYLSCVCHGKSIIILFVLSLNIHRSFTNFYDTFRLRYTQPDLVRPIRVNLFWPILYLLATVFVTVVPMYASPYETGYGCLMILTSVPVYFILIAWKNKPKAFQEAMGKNHVTLKIIYYDIFLWSVD